MKATAGLEFNVGDRVIYVINGKIQFKGTITKAERVRGQKPYTGIKDDGTEFFANESFVLPESTPLYTCVKSYALKHMPTKLRFIAGETYLGYALIERNMIIDEEGHLHSFEPIADHFKLQGGTEYQIRIADKSTVLKEGEFTITLSAEFRKTYKVICTSYAEASAALRGYVSGFELGASMFRGGKTSLKNIYVSYNGRVWEGKQYTNDAVEITDFERDEAYESMFKTFYTHFSNLLFS